MEQVGVKHGILVEEGGRRVSLLQRRVRLRRIACRGWDMAKVLVAGDQGDGLDLCNATQMRVQREAKGHSWAYQDSSWAP